MPMRKNYRKSNGCKSDYNIRKCAFIRWKAIRITNNNSHKLSTTGQSATIEKIKVDLKNQIYVWYH